MQRQLFCSTEISLRFVTKIIINKKISGLALSLKCQTMELIKKILIMDFRSFFALFGEICLQLMNVFSLKYSYSHGVYLSEIIVKN